MNTVGMLIWKSSQWHWFQPILTAGSKLRFLGPPGIDFGSNLVKVVIKVVKKLQEARVLCKIVKSFFFLARVWTLFDLWSTLGSTRGILGHFSWKRHFGCPGAGMGCAMPFWTFSWTHGEKMIFLDFFGSGMQIDDGQNMVSIHAYTYTGMREHDRFYLWLFTFLSFL